jgi:Uma2 family endonuclease
LDSGAPDLVVDVLSPGPRIGETGERVGWYAQYGVRECWLVHLDRPDVTVMGFANRQVATKRLFNWREPIVSAVLPGFTEPLNKILEP